MFTARLDSTCETGCQWTPKVGLYEAGRCAERGVGLGQLGYVGAIERIGVRSASGWGVRGEGFAPVSIITVCERREAKGLDAHVPLILRGDALYDPDLDRIVLALHLSVVRHRPSLRAYAYDVAVGPRILVYGGKTVVREGVGSGKSE